MGFSCSCHLLVKSKEFVMLLSFICKNNSRTWLSAVAYWWCVFGLHFPPCSVMFIAVSVKFVVRADGLNALTIVTDLKHCFIICLFTRLSNLFHGMDKNTPVRYTVYCSLIKVAASCGAIQYIPTELDQVSYDVEYLFCL